MTKITLSCHFLLCIRYHVLSLYQTTNFRPKEFADDNFDFGENGGKFSESIENTVGKGEIARYEQFLLFLQCFHKTCTADM